MISPRSFITSRQTQQLHKPPHRPPSASSSPSSRSPPSSAPAQPLLVRHKEKDERLAEDRTSSTSSSDITIFGMPAKRREVDTKSPAVSPPRTTTTVSRPTMPSNPVQIPSKHKLRETARPVHQHRHHGSRGRQSSSQRSKEAHNPDAIPASVAALLAVTSIPPPRSRSLRQTRNATEKRMTVESIIERSQESEKELSLTLSKGPMDLLLTPPEDLEDDDLSVCDSALGSVLSTRTVSLESMPSLVESFSADALSSLDSPRTPGRGRRARPTHRSLEPIASPPGKVEADHPLSTAEIVVDVLDFRVFDADKDETEDKKSSRMQFKPLKSAFKSNLTASLRALRQAARSFSTLNFPSIPPEDFLTRSILTLDPQVPYTDERRPQLEEEPTAELRRYLNPTTSIRLEQPLVAAPSPTAKTFTASIQMQTYKVHRPRGSSSASGRAPYPSTGPSGASRSGQNAQQKPAGSEYPLPGPRQREMRENSDFIRIAVMEMAMRKRGKLDDQQPGRARWALPPRKTSTRTYAIGADGVPARWVAISYDG
ncbi:hypothetical protein QBC34DRAFT_12791 [Podospora aff. communis PSN243]|uniref:Uncharacterized protein n=1 Tax=Podospora aff. communis PSN243 TaxID=3040156 RepID=A0AAV9H8G2_9PEZI|nr:hypothetical protein QBC34DRAFT_12791 [Podospora aff. communis PSN243]